MLKMNHISKSFPGVKALDDISIELNEGDILGLVGENGAGKSTLMKILSGAYTLDDGEIIINGEKIEHPTPAGMIEKGVAVIYQELMLLPHFTVAENIYQERYPMKSLGRIDFDKMNRDAKEVLDRVGLSVDPGDYVKDLSVARRQMVEIAKAISKNARIIVLDEPTAVLADEELKTLFELVKTLASQGISFVYISHRLKEIFELCNKITIMKDGKLVENGITSDYDTDKLVEKMVGREMGDIYPKRSSPIGDVVLKVEGLTRKGVLDHVSLELRKGEVLGLAGLAGAGRTETLRAIIGADKIDEGRITLFGREQKFDNINQALMAGFGIVPEERKTQGLQLNNSMVFNVSLPALHLYSNKYGKISIKKERDTTDEYIKLFQIRPGYKDIRVKYMSGGNQQKVVLAKWIAANCKILLVDEPTRGVDVGSKREIYTILNSLLEQGLSIIMASSELPELIGTCDRICVMNEGRITGELTKDEFSEEKIMKYATRDLS
ncbi:MAG: sugar ABC transporter ATP-binding protein [Lachnospiraceae bacterium]|nr:sugar ABC transporter ATP-binding protein [Lachnospiraceae bacterium]